MINFVHLVLNKRRQIKFKHRSIIIELHEDNNNYNKVLKYSQNRFYIALCEINY